MMALDRLLNFSMVPHRIFFITSSKIIRSSPGVCGGSFRNSLETSWTIDGLLVLGLRTALDVVVLPLRDSRLVFRMGPDGSQEKVRLRHHLFGGGVGAGAGAGAGTGGLTIPSASSPPSTNPRKNALTAFTVRGLSWSVGFAGSGTLSRIVWM